MTGSEKFTVADFISIGAVVKLVVVPCPGKMIVALTHSSLDGG